MRDDAAAGADCRFRTVEANLFSMKVVRCSGQRLARENFQPTRLDVNHSVLILESSFNEEELCASNHEAITFIEVGGDDGIRDSGFVLHGQEDESLCRAWALPGYDASCCLYKLAVSATV